MKCVPQQLCRHIRERKQNLETPSELHNYVVVAFLSWAAGDMQQCITLMGQVCQPTWTSTENKWVRNSCFSIAPVKYVGWRNESRH